MQKPLLKPRQLGPGSRIATVSPSWGGPGTFPQRYLAGKRQLEEVFGVTVVEMQHTLAAADWVSANPKARADDLMAAFADPSIDGIITTIGGEDCIRLLPFLDLEIIRNNPKVFLGFSDTTALHLACYKAGLGSFYGPAIMAGFAENAGMHGYAADGVRRALFCAEPVGTIPRNTEGWTTEHLGWDRPELQSRKRKLNPADPPRILQGSGKLQGHLLGGCVEVLEMTKGTPWWPSLEEWTGAILFLETSEDVPSGNFVRYWLRNYAAQGILGVVSAILIARADPGTNPHYQTQIEEAVTTVLAQSGLRNLPVMSGLDFGHTQPMLTLPYGALAEIDCEAATLTVLESGVV